MQPQSQEWYLVIEGFHVMLNMEPILQVILLFSFLRGLVLESAAKWLNLNEVACHCMRSHFYPQCFSNGEPMVHTYQSIMGFYHRMPKLYFNWQRGIITLFFWLNILIFSHFDFSIGVHMGKSRQGLQIITNSQHGLLKQTNYVTYTLIHRIETNINMNHE